MGEQFHARLTDLGGDVPMPVLVKDDAHADETVVIEDGEGFVRASDLATAKAEIKRLEEAWRTQQNLLVAAREEKGQDEDRIAGLRTSRDNWTARAGRAGRELQTARERIEEVEIEKQNVLDAINLYGDETLHNALDGIGWPRGSASSPPAPKEEG